MDNLIAKTSTFNSKKCKVLGETGINNFIKKYKLDNTNPTELITTGINGAEAVTMKCYNER